MPSLEVRRLCRQRWTHGGQRIHGRYVRVAGENFRRPIILRQRRVRGWPARHDEGHTERAAPRIIDQRIVAPRGFGDAVEFGNVAFKAQFPHAESRRDGHHDNERHQPDPAARLPVEIIFQPTRQPQWRLATRFCHRDEQRQNHEREPHRENHADRAEQAELLVAVHRRAHHHQKRCDGGNRAETDRKHQPAQVPPNGLAIRTGRVVEVIDDVDRVIHRDT